MVEHYFFVPAFLHFFFCCFFPVIFAFPSFHVLQSPSLSACGSFTPVWSLRHLETQPRHETKFKGVSSSSSFCSHSRHVSLHVQTVLIGPNGVNSSWQSLGSPRNVAAYKSRQTWSFASHRSPRHSGLQRLCK
jgi:hypothetical protein